MLCSAGRAGELDITNRERCGGSVPSLPANLPAGHDGRDEVAEKVDHYEPVAEITKRQPKSGRSASMPYPSRGVWASSQTFFLSDRIPNNFG